LKFKEPYQVKIQNSFAALEKFDEYVDIGKAWKTVRQNIKMSVKGGFVYYETKHHKWFDEECSKILHQRKQSELLRLQTPSQKEMEIL
jgi:hypothetical protein